MFKMQRAIETFTSAFVRLCVPCRIGELQMALSCIPQEIGHAASRFRITTEGFPRPLRPTIREEVCRIARECLLNAFRHSQASQIEAELHFTAHSFGMLIHDNGCGMDSQKLNARSSHGGLSAISERAKRIGAQFRVMSRIALGTEIELLLSGGIAFEPQNLDVRPEVLHVKCLQRSRYSVDRL
jgi:nitrate/nitrite-specific signal transduction histidine kinase